MNELYSVPTGQEVMQEVSRSEEPLRVSTNWAGGGASLRGGSEQREGSDLTARCRVLALVSSLCLLPTGIAF